MSARWRRPRCTSGRRRVEGAGHPHLAWLLVALGLVAAAVGASGPRFYPDDPLARFPETQDASEVGERPASEAYDFVESTLLQPGDRDDRRAGDVNTIDEVPDSSWFTNRIGTRPMSLDELARGSDQSSGPAPGLWWVQSTKREGATPGFTMRDAEGALYFIKFDPPGHLEMASAAEVIATKIFYALGFNVPENFVATFHEDELDVSQATYVGVTGHERPMRREDIDDLLAGVAHTSDGTYRVLASKSLPGKPLGPFRYFGTRLDDPNDIVPHEHRRELRAVRVFAAWLNHMDSRGINTLDTLVDADDRWLVRHHLLDFGSTLGSAGIEVKSRRSGNEYLWDAKQSVLRMVTFGLVVPAWTTIDFPDLPSVGRFEADHFVPESWVPHYPNRAFQNARPDDLFWAARRVVAFSDEAIRAVVRTGQLSDPQAERYLGDVLMARRDKIGTAWLTVLNPLVDFVLHDSGVLTFENAAEVAGVSVPGSTYHASWATFDNATGIATEVGLATTATQPRLSVPDALLARAPAFIRVQIKTTHAAHPAWQAPVTVYLRRTGAGWRTVGLDRMPDEP